ncbi:restriction endonuclease subunit S [Streptococcus sp. 20925_1_77]|uniref:restriction endonuclease subunit S n=1 Tax=Streptococcus sp. 20925_1_77 TaxID=3003654 RepID=UPI00352BF457
MSEFKTYTLDQLCIVGSSKRVHLSDYVQQGIPFYRSKEVIELSSGKNISEQLFISSEKYSEIKSKFPVPQENDVLITAVGTIGEILVVKDPNFYFKDGNLIWLRNINFEIIDIDYLYYFLKSDLFQKTIKYNNIGAVQKALTIDFLKTVKITLPSLDNQRKLISVLKSIDKKLKINNQINQELEAMAKTLYDYWFVQFDFPDQNGNPYKSSGGKMVYHPELKREIPEGWGVEKLGNITICHDSKRVPLSSNDRVLVKGEIPYYGATGIMDYVNDYIFDGDYVLMAEDGSVMTEKGTPILQRISGKNWVNNHAHVLEPIKNYSCKLLMMLLKDVSVMKIKTGSIQMKINQENMNKIVVPAIPLKLLFEINQKLEVIDKQQLNLIEENKQLTQLRDWLLPMLMNGQVKVE